MKKRPKQLSKEAWEHIYVALKKLEKWHEYLEQCDGETLLDLYNEIYGTEYEDEDVEWDN